MEGNNLLEGKRNLESSLSDLGKVGIEFSKWTAVGFAHGLSYGYALPTGLRLAIPSLKHYEPETPIGMRGGMIGYTAGYIASLASLVGAGIAAGTYGEFIPMKIMGATNAASVTFELGRATINSVKNRSDH